MVACKISGMIDESMDKEQMVSQPGISLKSQLISV
jgi:hypothetical protein